MREMMEQIKQTDLNQLSTEMKIWLIRKVEEQQKEIELITTISAQRNVRIDAEWKKYETLKA